MTTFGERVRERRLELVGNVPMMLLAYGGCLVWSCVATYFHIQGASFWAIAPWVLIPSGFLGVCSVLYEAPFVYEPEEDWVLMQWQPSPEQVGQSPEQFQKGLQELQDSGLVKIDSDGNVLMRSWILEIPLDDPCWRGASLTPKDKTVH